MSEVLVLPNAKTPKKKRVAVNSKAVCVTDTDVLEELKRKKAERVEVEQAIAARKLNRDKKEAGKAREKGRE